MEITSNKSVKKNIVFNLIRVICRIVFPLISFPYAARVLGVVNIGKVNYCTSVINYFVLFAGLGISVYATREGVKFRDSKDELSAFVKEVLLINIVSTIVSYIALAILIIGHFFDNYLEIIWISSLLVAFTTFGIEWLYQILEDFQYISIRSIAIQIISFISLLLFVRNASDYPIYAMITVFATGGNCFINIWQSRKYVNWRGNYYLDCKKHLKPIFIIFGISLSTSIYLSLDTVMVGRIRGDYEVGLYSAAVKLNSVVKTLITSISSVLLSRLSYYITQNKRERYIDLLRQGSNIILIMVLPACFGLLYLNKEVLLLFCGKEYASANLASIILSVNMVFSVIDGMLYNQICLPNGLERKASVATFVGALLNFGLNMFFIKRWGYIGAAFTTLISECTVFVILVWASNRVVQISQVFDRCYQYLIGNVFMVFTIWIIGKVVYINIFFHVFISVLAGIIVYVISLLILKNELIYKILRMVVSKNAIKKW